MIGVLGAALGLTLLLAGCGGGARPAAAEPPKEVDTGEFTLAVSPDSLLDRAEAAHFALSEREASGETKVLIQVTGAKGLKALFAEVQYDARRYTPVAAVPSSEFGGAGEVLSLAIFDEPGVVHYGQVLANFNEREGLSGNLILAEIRFRFVPAASSAKYAAHRASSVPTADAAASNLTYDTEHGYQWRYANPGDYNQDGLVSINDLTPLGIHFGEDGPFPESTAEWMIDGNGDGAITVSDITPIGVNFNNSVLGGYNVYVSTDPADYPAANDAASTIPQLEQAPLADALGDSALDRLHFVKYFTVPVAEFNIWLRPVDNDGNEGTPSNLLHLAFGPPAGLSLITPAVGGSGTLLDPYIVDASTDYEIAVIHPDLGDITDAIGVFYIISPLVAGTTAGIVSPLDKLLEIEDDFTGMFMLKASFHSVSATPELYFRVPNPANALPTAFFLADPDTGPAPLAVHFDATGSNDSDGVILQYEWDYDGDGSWDEALEDSDAYHTYELGGVWTAALRVMDDNGDYGTTSWPIEVEGWEQTVLDDRTGSGTDPSLALIDGRPAVAYTDSGGNLDYVRALDAAGDEWGAVVQLSSTFNASQVCLREIDGRPGVVFRRESPASSGIRYTLGTNADGTSWHSYVELSSGENDHTPSLELIDGRPAVAFVWYSGALPREYQLQYIRAGDSTGTGPGAWDAFPSILFEAELLMLDQQSLTTVENKPAILFLSDHDELDGRWKLRLIIADDIPATGWGFPSPVGLSTVGETGYLAVTSIVSRPNIAWRNEEVGTASFRRAANLDGTDWGSPYVIGDVGGDGNGGFFLDLANIAGFPAICHYNVGDGQLRYVRSDGVEGMTWGHGQVVATVGEWDTAVKYNRYVSLASNAGQPMIAYYDATDTKLKFARFYELP